MMVNTRNTKATIGKENNRKSAGDNFLVNCDKPVNIQARQNSYDNSEKVLLCFTRSFLNVFETRLKMTV